MTEPTLSEADVPADPFVQFKSWYDDARNAQLHEPDAMTLATASIDGAPSARMVLLKGFDERGFVFYSNFDSAKGLALQENPRAALILFWSQLYRQIRIEGTVTRVSDAESDAYFQTRPKGSRIAALASNQSRILPSRDILDARVGELAAQYSAPDARVPRPDYWGGYRVAPEAIEFWQGRRDRLHDRLVYRRQASGAWQIERLFP